MRIALAILLASLGCLPVTCEIGRDPPGSCFLVEEDVDAYLFSRYQLTPKIDEYGDFTDKDERAARHAGMTLKAFDIGGMDKQFRHTLYFAMKLMVWVGFNPGILTAFRDDFRQSITQGRKKAAVGYSFHGGSARGGYGHGLAADLVSLNGTTRHEQLQWNEKLYQWIDANRLILRVGRPYNDDAGHVAPLTSPEFDLARSLSAEVRHHRAHMEKSQRRQHHYAAHKRSTTRA